MAGSGELIERARRFRKQFGGGMRQAGILAAGALHALYHHRERLAEDHANARSLAMGLSAIPGLRLAVEEVETNMVFFGVAPLDARAVVAGLKERGVLVLATGTHTLRAVASLAVDAEDIVGAVGAIRDVMARVAL